MRCAFALPVLVATLLSGPSAFADWLTAPSFYTHDPATGQRADRYAAPPPAAVPQPASFQSSGYTHLRSSIQVGQSADNYHRVEKWGPPVRPYGEWRFPFRPYSVPYDQWGAPLAGMNIGTPIPYGYPAPPAGGGHGRGPGRHGGDAGERGRPGSGRPGYGYPGHGYRPSDPNQPYPSGPNSPYPVPPQADGYYPSYPHRPKMGDERFFEKPRQEAAGQESAGPAE